MTRHRCGLCASTATGVASDGWRLSDVFGMSRCPACVASERSMLFSRTYRQPEGGRVRRRQRLQAERELRAAHARVPGKPSGVALSAKREQARAEFISDPHRAVKVVAAAAGVSPGLARDVRDALLAAAEIPADVPARVAANSRRGCSPEKQRRIRELADAGWTMTAICADLKCNQRTVRKYAGKAWS